MSGHSKTEGLSKGINEKVINLDIIRKADEWAKYLDTKNK